MSSPFDRKADQLKAEAALPGTNWLEERRRAVEDHAPSIETGLRTLGDMASMLLNGRISTDIRIEHPPIDFEDLHPSEELGYIACSIIPALRGLPRDIPSGRGYSWTPDVALQLCFSFKDKYKQVETTAGRTLQPTGNVSLYMNARTWGCVSEEDINAICQLDERVWTTYGDNGHSRKGTHMQAIFQRGEVLTRELAETMLAPLAGHVIDYFALVHKPHLADWQQPGNFSDVSQQDTTSRYSPAIFDVTKMIGTDNQRTLP